MDPTPKTSAACEEALKGPLPAILPIMRNRMQELEQENIALIALVKEMVGNARTMSSTLNTLADTKLTDAPFTAMATKDCMKAVSELADLWDVRLAQVRLAHIK